MNALRCFWHWSLWRRARALDRASVVLWRMNEFELSEELQKHSLPLWGRIHKRHNSALKDARKAAS